MRNVQLVVCAFPLGVSSLIGGQIVFMGTVCPPTTRLTVDYSGNVGLGIAPAHPLHLAGGAYSDGVNWINGSSREYKDDAAYLDASFQD